MFKPFFPVNCDDFPHTANESVRLRNKKKVMQRAEKGNKKNIKLTILY